MNTLQAKMRSDKRKNPELLRYEVLDAESVRALSGHAYILDRAGE